MFHPEIIFKPIDATGANIDPISSSITVDTQGEYIVVCRNVGGDTLLKYIAFTLGRLANAQEALSFLRIASTAQGFHINGSPLQFLASCY